MVHLYIVLIGGLLIAGLLSHMLERRKRDNITIKEYAITIVCFLLLMFGFMGYTGILSSGYHLIDDHEIYTIGKDLSKFGYWKTVYRQIFNDLHIRFRFTYYLIRVTECYLFGDNFVLWHSFQTVIAAAGLFFSYVFARKMECTVLGAYIFTVIIFIGGGQAAVWWRLGPQENLGIILLMLTLISLQCYLQKNKISNLILSIALTVFLGGIKEAFLLLLPLLPVWLVYWEINLNGQEVSWKGIRIILQKRWIYFLATYLVFLIDMAVILLYVGINRIGYAGIDDTYGIVDYIRGIWYIVIGKLRLYIITSMIGVLFLFVLLCISWMKGQRELLFRLARCMIIPILTFGYFLGGQLILHVKSGMFERYLLPATVAFAYFWLIDLNGFIRFDKKIMKGYYVFVTFMALTLIVGVNDEEQARTYAADGKNTTSMLSMAAAYADKNPNIIVGEGYEKDFSSSVYLQEKYHVKSVYNLYYSTVENGIVRDGYLCDADEKEAITIDEAQMFIGYPDMLIPIMEEYGISRQNLESYAFGDYVLYIVK